MALSALGPGSLASLRFEQLLNAHKADLHRFRARQLLDLEKSHRKLIGHEPVTQERLQFLLADSSRALAQSVGGHRHGAQPRIRQPDDDRLVDRWMGLQGRCNVLRLDLEATSNDCAVCSALDPKETIGIEDSKVGGTKPFVAVADMRRLEFEQAEFTRLENRSRYRLGDARLDALVDAADAAALFAEEPTMVIGGPSGNAAELRCAIVLQDGDPVPLIEQVCEIGIECSSAGAKGDEARQVVLADAGVHDHPDRGRRRRYDFRPMPYDRAHKCVDRELSENAAFASR